MAFNFFLFHTASCFRIFFILLFYHFFIFIFIFIFFYFLFLFSGPELTNLIIDLDRFVHKTLARRQRSPCNFSLKFSPTFSPKFSPKHTNPSLSRNSNISSSLNSSDSSRHNSISNIRPASSHRGSPFQISISQPHTPTSIVSCTHQGHPRSSLSATSKNKNSFKSLNSSYSRPLLLRHGPSPPHRTPPYQSGDRPFLSKRPHLISFPSPCPIPQEMQAAVVQSNNMTPSASPPLSNRELKEPMNSSNNTSSLVTPEPRPSSGNQRHRPPMLNLDSQTSIRTSPNNNTNPSSASLAGVNLSHLNRNTATTTTTLSATPSSAIFPALRTPKDIVLQDIAVQCISPALPSFGSSVLDAMARSKTIQEEQRKLIAQRMLDEDENSVDGNAKVASSASHSPAKLTSASRSPNKEPSSAAEPRSSNENSKNHPNELAKPSLIVSEYGDIIIETVPTPTETRLKVNPSQSSMNSAKRKARPNSIQLFPYTRGPSIRSAPLRHTPYSPHAVVSTPGQSRRVPSGSVPKKVNGLASLNSAVPQSATFKPLVYPRPVRPHVIAAPLTAVPGMHASSRGGASYTGWPQYEQALRGRPAIIRGPVSATATVSVPVEEDDDDDDEEDDGRDPEDAALSDDEADDTTRVSKKPSLKQGSQPATVQEEDEDEEDDDEHMSDIEKRAIAEEDELSFQRKKKRRMLQQEGDGRLKEAQLKKQRFLELCSELWDVFRS